MASTLLHRVDTGWRIYKHFYKQLARQDAPSWLFHNSVGGHHRMIKCILMQRRYYIMAYRPCQPPFFIKFWGNCGDHPFSINANQFLLAIIFEG